MGSPAATRWKAQGHGPVATMEYGGRTRAGCAACRKKKLKCDNETPSCVRCKKSGEACIRGFTHRSYNESPEFNGFKEDQIWVHPRNIQKDFISENSMTASHYDIVSSPSTVSPTTEPMESTQKASTQLATPSLPRLPELDTIKEWPLTNPNECHLFRNFEKNLAVWLDLCDPECHFQVEVIRRASSSKILLNAIFALSALHLSRTRTYYDPIASTVYHTECLGVLIPMLKDSSTMEDETLFAATIILRVLEEIDMPESNSHIHLTGIKHFVDARDPYATGRSLSEAAFWVGLRQEIYSALTNHQPIQLKLEHSQGELEPATGYTWANRAVIHCAKVMNSCFSDCGISRSKWKELDQYSKEWTLRSAFVPIKNCAGSDSIFPKIVYPFGYQIIGIQHYYLAQMLLEIFDPKIPRFGPNRKDLVHKMEVRVMGHLKKLCGIGEYNSDTAPALFTASMGIAIAGDLFHDRTEQERLLQLLLRTEREHARPTAAIQKQLKDAWAWSD